MYFVFFCLLISFGIAYSLLAKISSFIKRGTSFLIRERMLVTELCRVRCLISLGCLFWARCHTSIGSAGSNSAPLKPFLRAKIYITIKMAVLFNGEMKPNCQTELPTSFLSFFFFLSPFTATLPYGQGQWAPGENVSGENAGSPAVQGEDTWSHRMPQMVSRSSPRHWLLYYPVSYSFFVFFKSLSHLALFGILHCYLSYFKNTEKMPRRK